MSKSLVAARDLPAGHVVGPDDIAMRTPGGGMWPYQLDEVVGHRLGRDLHADEAFAPADLSAAGAPATS
jgi:N-acetylneuraminate synthase/sialic acid synthase